MIVIQKYGVTGHYLHQSVDGLEGNNHEIKEYGRGFQDGEYGAFGVVLYPHGRGAKPETLLVIHIKGKWVPTKEESIGIRLTTDAYDRAGDRWTTFETTGWVPCDYPYCGKSIRQGWKKGTLGVEEEQHYCSEHITKE